MNHREPTSVPRGTGQTFPCLALLILPLLVVCRAWARPMLPPPTIPSASKPYLGAIGAPPVRFQEPAPPPDLVTRPAAAAPPQPSTLTESADGTPTAANPSNSPLSTSTVPTTPVAPAVNPTTDSAAASDSDASVPARTPPPILRDEIHRQTRAEDFLPFFQIPIPQPGDVTVVPVPRQAAPLPNSSATYTQSPK